MTDAMTDVTDEFIAEMSRSDVDTNIRSMAREIQRRRASDRWVPWKPGDVLPAHDLYPVIIQDFTPHTDGNNQGTPWNAYATPAYFECGYKRVIAYWPTPVATFDSSMGDQHG
jgi:hypothetical protein